MNMVLHRDCSVFILLAKAHTQMKHHALLNPAAKSLPHLLKHAACILGLSELACTWCELNRTDMSWEYAVKPWHSRTSHI